MGEFLQRLAGAFGFMCLIIDIIIAVLLIFKLMNSGDKRERGTNRTTRMVRDTTAYAAYGRVQLFGTLTTLLFVGIGLILGRFWVGLPTLAPVLLAFVFKRKSTKDPQRVQDSRSMTKSSLEITGAAGPAIGTTAGVAAGAAVGHPVAGAAIGAAVGESGAKVALKAAKAMADTDSIGVGSSDMTEVNTIAKTAGQAVALTADANKFMEAAKRVGVATDGEDVDVVANRVYGMIPENVRAQLSDKSEQEAAMLFLEGKV